MEKRLAMKYILIVFLFLCSINLWAEAPVIKTHLFKDTVQLGEPFKVALSVKHALNTDITVQENFTNGVEKIAFLPFPTQSHLEDFVIDSGIYTLRVFANKPFVKFQIPVAVVTKNDTIKLNQQDSLQIHIKKEINQLPESIHFDNSAQFFEPDYPFDYISWGIAGGIVLTLGVVLLLVFSSQISVWWKTRRLKKAFLELQLYVQKLPSSIQSKNELETILHKWKTAQGKIENKTLSAFTTKELNLLYQDQQLNGILRDVDASIYGREKEISKTEIEYLLQFSENRLNVIIEQLKGKSK